MKAIFDLNVVLDVALRRAPFFDDSFDALMLSARRVVDGYFPAGSMADVWYVCRKAIGGEAARSALMDLTAALHICDTPATSVTEALLSPMTDFEDAVLAACAKRIGADVIVTRDLDDFKMSHVPAVSPADFVKMIAASKDGNG